MVKIGKFILLDGWMDAIIDLGKRYVCLGRVNRVAFESNGHTLIVTINLCKSTSLDVVP